MTDHAELIERLRAASDLPDTSGVDPLLVKVMTSLATVMSEAAAALAARVAERDALIADISKVVDGARPYKDESGVIEIPLHTFGILFRIHEAARALKAQEPQHD